MVAIGSLLRGNMPNEFWTDGGVLMKVESVYKRYKDYVFSIKVCSNQNKIANGAFDFHLAKSLKTF